MCLVMMSYLVDVRTLLCISSKKTVCHAAVSAPRLGRVRARSR